MISITTFVFSPIQENTYLLFNEQKDCIIIDPGCYFPAEKQKLKETIAGMELNPVLLLNTHCHLDHVFGNSFVAETWNLQPHIHPQEQPVLDRAGEAGKKWGLPFDNYTGPVTYLQEGDTVSLGQDVFEVFFTPGHSPGSISFYNEKQGFIVSGDVLFDRSIGRTDLPGGDYDTLINSIQQKLFTLPDDIKVYSGHGNPTTTGFEKMNNPFVKMY
ncbi:MBL fold metallo-hydrolase [Terrimonas rubra]|uniref:MBL fold metallo-hydrolase n=1 Tax=Terrimonas rubra TaxID=1035890 RepID=A0ABW6A4B7_9BACT